MSHRLEQLRAIIARENLDALIITQPENRRYISGFTGSAGVLIISAEHALLATDFRYYEQVRVQAPSFRLVEATDSMPRALAETLASLRLSRVGFESHDVTVQIYEQWKAAMGDIEWVPTTGLMEELRQIKDADEIRAIEGAVRIADEAMAHLMEWMRPGVTERQVAWELEVAMRTRGAEKMSFTPIVGSGPNGAMSHAVTSDRPIAAGEPVVIDMGAMYQGYCSDITRSFCLSHADDEYLRIWETVLLAQQTAESAIRAGISGIEADAAARDVIYGAGYEGKFGHGLGHGVGLAIHEPPRASRLSTDVLQAGTIVTVEPGIYIPGWGGIRIEDMVVVTEEGCRVLTAAAKVPVVAAN
jgi:Xaa-Pro aminopeptidase